MAVTGTTTPRRIDSAYRIMGPVFLFAATVFVSAYYIPQLQSAQIKYFIVLIAVTISTIYSYSFLIAPEFDHRRGLWPVGASLLAILLILSFFISGLLISIYVDKTFLATKSNNDLYVVRAIIAALAPVASDTSIVPTIVKALSEHHFIIFVVIFSLMDIVFLRWAPEEDERKKFRRVFFVIDLPILAAVFGTLQLAQPAILGENWETYEAGALSFQFMSGTVAAYFLDITSETT